MKSCYVILAAVLTMLLILFPIYGTCVCKNGNSNKEGLTNNTTGSTSTKPTVYYGPNNETAVVTSQNTLIITNLSGTQSVYAYKSTSTTSSVTTNTYSDSDKHNAVVISTPQGVVAIQVSSGSSTTPSMYYPTNNDTTDSTSTTGTTTESMTNATVVTSPTKASPSSSNTEFNTFYASNGDVARLIGGQNTEVLVLTIKSSGDVIVFNIDASGNTATVKKFVGPNSQNAVYSKDSSTGAFQVTLTSGSTTTVFVATKPMGSSTQPQSHMHTPTAPSSETVPSATASSSSIPATGISQSSTSSTSSTQPPQTVYPTNQDNLYILKSSIVPPVCPTCPQPIVQCGGDSKKHGSKDGDDKRSRRGSNSGSSHNAFAHQFAQVGQGSGNSCGSLKKSNCSAPSPS
jgi:hypothetical protein